MVGLAPAVSNTATSVKTGTATSRQAGLDQLDALGKSMLQQRSVLSPFQCTMIFVKILRCQCSLLCP